jgi:hypothetical protein
MGCSSCSRKLDNSPLNKKTTSNSINSILSTGQNGQNSTLRQNSIVTSPLRIEIKSEENNSNSEHSNQELLMSLSARNPENNIFNTNIELLKTMNDKIPEKNEKGQSNRPPSGNK